MKGLTLTQPWAMMVALGAKHIETRSWGVTYRGPLAIHAAKGLDRIGGVGGLLEFCRREPFRTVLLRHFGKDGPVTLAKALPFGAIVAVANLHRVGEIGRRADGAVIVRGRALPVEGDELAFGDYTPGRRGWVLTNVGALKVPVPCKGARGLWDVPPDVMALLAAQGMGQ
jgi:activating signal cointegrator 1